GGAGRAGGRARGGAIALARRRSGGIAGRLATGRVGPDRHALADDVAARRRAARPPADRPDRVERWLRDARQRTGWLGPAVDRWHDLERTEPGGIRGRAVTWPDRGVRGRVGGRGRTRPGPGGVASRGWAALAAAGSD